MHGKLSDLEKLKEHFAPLAKEAAPKRHKIVQECADLGCRHLVGRVEVGKEGQWHIKSEWCTKKDCPRSA